MVIRNLRRREDDGQRMLHLRFMGQSRDVSLDVLGLTGEASDDAVRRTVARWLEIGENDLAGYVIERHSNGNMTVRPEAVFG